VLPLYASLIRNQKACDRHRASIVFAGGPGRTTAHWLVDPALADSEKR